VVHPEEDRHLTIEEAKRLCSFPDDFKLIGSFSEQWARLGNAVMPNQMKAIALHLSRGGNL
jgi:DNA (cytosine-5)-methyltransferase 1